MSYAKSFQAIITIYPEFNNDPYCQYLKENITEWIVDCFNSYTDFFKVNVSQSNETAQLYNFDVEKGDIDINLKKIWQKSMGKYNIFISGSGMINFGVKNNLEPPQNIMEDVLDKIYFKYQENSQIYPSKIITYGKNPINRIPEVPIIYTFDSYDNGCWQDGSKLYDVYSDKWKLSLKTNSSNFIKIMDILEEIKKINKNEFSKIYFDDFDNYLELSGQFILRNEDKQHYLYLLEKISEYFLEDEYIEIEQINMDFVADSDKTFYFETYFFDDTICSFKVKNIEI